jgi:hypothetical protein
MRKRSAIGAVAAAMLAAGGAGVPAVAGAGVTGAGVVGAVVHAPMRHIGATQYSSNWSGYALTGSVGSYHAVTAKWTVTPVQASAGATYSASWVGIDGDGNTDLIQTGTESDYYGGAAHYDAWWEILPAPETPVFSVKPGDVMTASITKGSLEWTITITDTTSGKTFTTNQAYTGPGSSAEWIEERPQVNGRLATLAKYSKVTFDPGTLNGSDPHLASTERILMLNNAGTKVISDPSKPDSDTDGFAVAHGSTAPAPPSS